MHGKTGENFKYGTDLYGFGSNKLLIFIKENGPSVIM